MTTLYDTLGVSDEADAEALKRAYRKAMMKWHPDRNAGNEAAAHAAFQEVKAAYAILSDPAQRREYDTIFAAEMRRWAAQNGAKTHEPARHGDSQHGHTKQEHSQHGHTQRTHTDTQREQAERDAAARERAEHVERERAERDEARGRAEAKYAERVALAMRYAGEGYNRDVVFGVLLGRQCEVLEAQRIADSVAAWHAPVSRATAQANSATPSPSDAAAHARGASNGRTDADPAQNAGQACASASASATASAVNADDATATSASASAAPSRSARAKSRAAGASTSQERDTRAARRPADTKDSGADPGADDAPANAGHIFGTLWYHFLNGLKP